MARITLILSVVTAVIALLGGFQMVMHEWRAMRERRRLTGRWFAILCLLCLPSLTEAALWTGVLDPSRATDWSQAGITGGIPNRTTICPSYSGSPTPMPASSTAAQISAAIQACSNNGSSGGYVVPLAAGTFNLSASILFTPGTYGTGTKNVTLRGAGPDQTILHFTGQSSCNNGGMICITDGVFPPGACGYNSPLPNRANWTANYTAGTTQITLDGLGNNAAVIPSTLVAGIYVALDQLDTLVPATGFATYAPFVTSNTPWAIYPQQWGRSGRQVAEWHKVTAVTGSGPYTVTIDPPLSYAGWSGSLSPAAWWCADLTYMLSRDGVEDLTVDNAMTGTTAGYGLISFSSAFESWAKNVRLINQPNALVYVNNAAKIEVRDSYLYGGMVQGEGCGSAGTQYGFDLAYAGYVKVENNIVQQTCSALMSQPCFTCLYGYNYTVGDAPFDTGNLFWAMLMGHVGAATLTLMEGNDTNGFDVDHAQNHGLNTGFWVLFRNKITGTQPGVTAATPIFLQGYNRFSSLVGNVLGAPGTFSVYEASPSVGGTDVDSGAGNAIYNLAWGCAHVSPPCGAPDDTITLSSLMRWGNYDYVTNTVRWVSGEVAPGSTGAYPQAVPATQVLPASFYLSAKPAWFGSSPWPVIGPEVTTGYDTSTHSGSNPARNCYLNVMNGPTNGSGSVLTFNANNCYVTTQAPPPVTRFYLRFAEFALVFGSLLWKCRTPLGAGILLIVNFSVATAHSMQQALPEAVQRGTYTTKVLAAKTIQAVLLKRK